MCMVNLDIDRPTHFYGHSYFHLEILSLPKGEVAGVGMTAEKEISQCIGHGTGHEA